MKVYEYDGYWIREGESPGGTIGSSKTYDKEILRWNLKAGFIWWDTEIGDVAILEKE